MVIILVFSNNSNQNRTMGSKWRNTYYQEAIKWLNESKLIELNFKTADAEKKKLEQVNDY
jgi:hypothetical protein